MSTLADGYTPSTPKVAIDQVVQELVRLRKKRKIRQGEIAEAVGLSQSMVSHIENGKATPSIETVMLYAAAVGARIQVVPINNGKWRTAAVSEPRGTA
ncbi:MAG: helix-turn-helix transcriptional regulator [Fimbriimonas sp.]|nr:helix-turn-helix transcriptional regulator [Fimbriimonas sp.]